MAVEEVKKTEPLNEFFYTWRVENVDLWWKDAGEKLKSPTFEVEWLPKCPFTLYLYPKGIEGIEGYISYFLFLENQAYIDNKGFKTNLYILAANGSKVNTEFAEGFLSMKKSGMLGNSRFMSWKTLMERKTDYFPDEILTLVCRIWSDVKKGMKGCSGKSFARTQIKKEVIAKHMVIDKFAPEGQNIGVIKSIMNLFPIATFSSSFGEISHRRSLDINIDIQKDKGIKMAILKLMLIDEKKKKIFWMNTLQWNDIAEFESIVLSLSSYFPKNSKRYAPNEMFDEKFLFLACQFTFTTGIVIQNREKDDYGTNLNHLCEEYLPSNVQTEYPTLANAMMSMHNDTLHCDVLFQSGEASIPAHKFVLYYRSTKFEKILKSEESAAPQVVLVEDLDTILKVKYFLYTDIISNMKWQTATTLYRAAINYGISLLKRKCCNFIKDNFDKSNVVEILLLGKEHNDVELIAFTRNFIMENRSDVYSSDEWDNFRKSHSDFAAEVMLPKFQSK